MRFIPYLCFLLFLFIFSSCQKPATRFLIGVSQCSDDEWRHKLNNEIRREALFYDGVEVEILSAKDNNQKQKEDIRYFIDKGVDLLVVSPNEAIPLTEIIEEAYDKQIPVIVVDRKILSDKYTAFIGADNYEIGKTVGEYIAARLGGTGNVVELSGLSGSTPAIDRHQGFVSALSKYPGIRLLASEDARWLRAAAENAMDTLLVNYPSIDFVFAQNDRMAVGAYLAASKQLKEKKINFVGIDALPGKDFGVDQVENGVLEATFIYPTGGERVMQLAMNILQKKPYERENILSTALVDKTNARVMKLQTDHITELDGKIELLNGRIGEYLLRFANQKIIIYAGLVILLSLACVVLVVLRANRSKNRMNAALSRQNDEITRQKEQLEEQRDQLIRLSAQLEEATHAKLMFFTNVSHDFRTPLTLIADPVEQLISTGSLTGEQEGLLRIVKRNVNILLRLVNEILEFREYENGKLRLILEMADLKRAVEEWNNSFFSAIHKKHIKFTFRADEGDYRMQMDNEKIERVYFNLLSNAFKFTPENGRITVTLSQVSMHDHDFIRLVVADTGVGISAEHIRNIFDRFYRTDIHHTGSGIGLALVKAFVEAHEGTVTVESQPGNGTVFTVEIPVHKDEIRSVNPVPVSSCQEPAVGNQLIANEERERNTDEMETDSDGKETILIVDDNQDIRDYIRLVLQKEYRVLEAVDGRDGLRKAMQFVPDLVVCDIMMPEMDGIECCNRLKSELQTSHIPVILLTACALDEQRIEGFKHGADSYISKPFNSQVLEARIRNLLENRKKLRKSFGDGTITVKEAVGDIDKQFIDRFRKLIEDKLSDSELSVEDLGSDMGLSRVQLYRKLKSLTNYSPNEFLRNTRLKRAASLLASSDMTIAEITYEVGFTSPSYFTKCYRDYFGESPTDFLKRKK